VTGSSRWRRTRPTISALASDPLASHIPQRGFHQSIETLPNRNHHCQAVEISHSEGAGQIPVSRVQDQGISNSMFTSNENVRTTGISRESPTFSRRPPTARQPIEQKEISHLVNIEPLRLFVPRTREARHGIGQNCESRIVFHSRT
jgi:hypothetical protein